MSVWLFVFLWPFLAFADDLEEIRVTGTKDPSQFHFGSSASVSEAQGTPRLLPFAASVLPQIPGVVSNQSGGPGGRVSVFIRGTEARHVAFTLDGLKLNDPSNIDRQFDSAFFSSSLLKEMKVFKGPQAVLFGSDAMGGLVSMRTRKGESAPETRLNIGSGSFNTYSSSLSKDWLRKESQGTVTVSQIQSDGVSRLNKKRFGATERDGMEASQITSSSQHKWNPKWQTDFLISFLRGRNKLDGALTDTRKDRSQNDQYIAQQKTSLAFASDTALSFRNGINRHQRLLIQEGIGRTSFSGNLVQNEMILEREKKGYSFLAGISADHEDTSLGNRSFDLYSGFAQVLRKFGDLSLQGGLRRERHTRYGNFTTGSGGVSYGVNKSQLYVQYSQGFKAPSLYQLYGPPIFGPVGNPNLVPERNHSWEAGWKFKGRHEAEVNVFQNRLSNLINYINNVGYQNQGEFISEGIELVGKLKGERMILAPSLTHQNFRKSQATVLRRPYNSAQLQFSYFLRDDLEGFTRARWNDARKDLDPNSRVVKLNPYEVVDVGLNLRVKNQDFGLQVTNIFNREYEDIYGFTVMPRAVFLNYGLKFQ